MDKFKRISSFIGIALLVLLYITTIITACIQSDAWAGLFKASIYATVTVPCLIYGMQLVYRVLKKRGEQ